MKINTSDLTGPALDWAVAKCEGIQWGQGDLDAREYGPGFKPSTDWAQGGPLIEQVKMGVFPLAEGYGWAAGMQSGPTPLVAAMRCYVASKLGDTIDVPEELTPPTTKTLTTLI